jgi:hypothetical protein
MRTKQLAAGAAIVGGVGLNLVSGWARMPTHPRPSYRTNPTLLADFHHRAGALRASPDIASDPGITSSTVAYDSGGFWYFGTWVQLFGSECHMPANSDSAEPHY